MKIDAVSIKWALNHLTTIGDSDLFPIPIEFEAIVGQGEEAINFLSDLDLSQVNPGSARRFIVPKDDLSYRVATQLDPLDSIFLAAIMYQFGVEIESKRRPVEENRVFSYRFAPDPGGNFYDKIFSWNEFWKNCFEKSKSFEYALVLDISDFYNQIYHHTLENQLAECGLPNQVIKWIIALSESITAKTSRGIPVGPHSAHLLAEISLKPIDNSLVTRGIEFCRFVDDIIVFCNSETEAKINILTIADILDKQQRLMLQRHKTKILDKENFQKYCNEMLEDRPINDLETNLLKIIRKHSGGNPYGIIYLSQLSAEELNSFNDESITKIFNDYISQTEPDYTRLRWFIRRLSQVGHPGAVNYCVDNINKLMPALNDICQYFVSVSNFSASDWPILGEKILNLLDDPIIQANEYYQLSIYSLFNRKLELNHFEKILRNYQANPSNLKRETIIAAFKYDAADWLRELKEHYRGMDRWTQRAFLVACSKLPREEKRFFFSQVSKEDKLDELLILWSKK
ncbi:MAG: hypothetical protein H6Q66_1182 [Firmicutes bacterium]|nr:hypothetical protein [Bacillota bacterium]